MPKINLNLKRALLKTNRRLDVLTREVNDQSDYWFWYDRSHTPEPEPLSYLQRATLYLEDRRFASHFGVELRMFPRLLRLLFLGRRLGGISTIDQQVVRIIRGRFERTLTRKTSELFFALLINAHLPKERIFHYYLHFAYLGYKLEGVEIASKFLFAKRAYDLNVDQACLVASLFARPAPKSVVIAALSSGGGLTPEDMFDVADASGDTVWAKRCRMRYEFARQNYALIPSNLFTK